MALTVATNTGALMAQAAASSVNKEMETSMERLATGKRINSASDDAAGMAISSKLEAQIKGIGQAIRNAQDGQNLIDTAESAHMEVTNILQRMRELAVQSANDTLVSTDRASMNIEVNQLIAELDRISGQTTFNSMSLLDGSFTSKHLQIGADQGHVATFSIDSTAAASLGQFNTTLAAKSDTTAAGATASDTFVLTGSLGSSTITVASAGTAKTIAGLVNAVTGDTNVTATATTKARMHTLSHAGTVSMTVNGTSTGDVVVAATTDIRGIMDAINGISGTTGVTATTGSSNAELILTHTTGESISIAAYVNSGNATAGLKLDTLDAAGADVGSEVAMVESTSVVAVARGFVELSSDKVFNVDASSATDFADATAARTAVSTVDVLTQSTAATAITTLDGALKAVASARAELGSISNRLDHTMSNLTDVQVASSKTLSNIGDADFAAETTNLAKTQILQQASTAMLAQANASKQNVLSLLQG